MTPAVGGIRRRRSTVPSDPVLGETVLGETVLGKTVLGETVPVRAVVGEVVTREPVRGPASARGAAVAERLIAGRSAR